MSKVVENKKISTKKTHSRTPWGIKYGSIPKKGVRNYLVSVSKTNLLVRAAKTKANQVLVLPLTVSTRRVDPTTSKAMVSKRVPMLAKSISEEGAQTQSQNSLEHFYERKKQMAFHVLSF